MNTTSIAPAGNSESAGENPAREWSTISGPSQKARLRAHSIAAVQAARIASAPTQAPTQPNTPPTVSLTLEQVNHLLETLLGAKLVVYHLHKKAIADPHHCDLAVEEIQQGIDMLHAAEQASRHG